jgi:membrane protein implicated in regulation of membrane protease activity
MDAWLLWIVVACVFGVAEMVTMGLFLAPFAMGAAVAALLAALGAGVGITLATFGVVALPVLFGVRPLLLSRRRAPDRIRTGTAALIGERAVVLEPIGNHVSGSVRIGGEVWTARAYEDEVIAAGAVVDVVEIRGVTAWVIE